MRAPSSGERRSLRSLSADPEAVADTPAGASGARGYPSPLRLFVLVAAAVFVSEVAVMFLLKWIAIQSPVLEAFVDACFLSCLVAPATYGFMYRPMVAHIAARRQAEDVLRLSHDELESRVSQRTRELLDANAQLEREMAVRIQGEEQLSLSAQVFENTMEGILITDAKGTIERVNRSFTEITGYTADEAAGRNPRILKSRHHDRAFYQAMWSSLAETGTWKGEIWNRRKGGDAYPQWLSITAIRNPAGQTTHYVGVFHDISERKRIQEQLHYQAHHDPLTGLPNRTLFNDRLKMAVARAERHRLRLAVLFIDLDDFKDINDSLGHETGDACLREVACRLQAICRAEDTVARIGGDEFVVMLPDTRTPDHAVNMADRILQGMKQPCRIGGHDLHLSASIGITFYPGEGNDPEALVRNADIAMYRAKECGKGAYRIFEARLHEELQQRVQLDHDLRRGLEQGEMELHYQPKVDLRTGTFDAVEALVRWRKPDGMLVSPGSFIPAAERSGLIVPLGKFVIEAACAQAAAWHAEGHRIRVSVNMATPQLLENDVEAVVVGALEKSGLPAWALELEVTESLFMKDYEKVAAVLRRLKDRGVGVALDDFGTGYSSLAHLNRLPVDTLKIDRSFIKDIPNSPYDMALTSAVLAIAENLGLAVVVEGVETEAQLRFVEEKGGKIIQGYYFCPPLPPEKLLARLRQGSASMVIRPSEQPRPLPGRILEAPAPLPS